MKIILFLISSLLFLTGCEKEFDGTSEPVFYSYQVTSLTSFDNITFTREDSVRTLNIIFNNTSDIKNVSYSLFDSFGDGINGYPKLLNKISGTLYSSQLTMSVNFPPGEYSLKYYVTDLADRTKEIAVHYFSYENIFYANTAPVIRNILINPDTLVVIDTTALKVTAEVFDENSPQDIQYVYFVVFRPDNSTSGNQTPLTDEGGNDDDTAGDGIYSRIISVNQTNQKGTYRFEFHARDKGGKMSEPISYFVLIQ